MREIFKVGEKVRLLHAKGEGVVQRVISPTRVEVLIDEFYEMELGVDEVVKINSAESILRNEEEEESDKPKKKGLGIGPSLAPAPDLPPSFVLFKNADQDYEFWLLNQGRNEVLFTCYVKVGNKFISYNSGSVMPRENHFIGRQTPAEFHMARLIYLQILQFPRIEHPKPIAPITLEINCKTDIFTRETKSVPELNVQGWEFVLEEKVEVQTSMLAESAVSDARLTVQKPPKPPKVVDLHIHKIISNPLGIDSHTMMRLQLEAFEKALTDAQAHHLDSMVFIHGIGNGTLKKEMHHRLMGFDFVKHYELADPVLYGNGATIVFF
ncbi:MAG: Smr/MutS family protein [Bacteroidetes bacterium]|nr:Smr/MutS family protein [Bacteroidota bacterium]MBP6640567.1 Smr/MutS family protein [Bacteroidia bacterium]